MKQNEIFEKNSVKRLLIKFSIPAILTMLLQAIYNLIDSIYISHAIGNDGLAAMGIVFPIIMLIMALTNLISIGGGSLISIAFGKNDHFQVNKIIFNIYFYEFVLSLSIMIFCLIFIKPILFFFGSSEAIYTYVYQYMLVIFFTVIIQIYFTATYTILRSVGKLKERLYAGAISIVINVIITPIFLFVFNMGMFGAAWGLILSQGIVLIFLIRFLACNGFFRYETKRITSMLKKNIFIESISIGASSCFRIAGSIAVLILVNHIADTFGGANSIALCGVSYKVMMILIMPAMGLIQGNQPIIGYNYGAGRIDRINKTVNFSVFLTIIYSIFVVVLLILFSKTILYIWGKELYTIKNAYFYILLINLATPLISIQSIISGYFQAVKKALLAGITALLGQFIILVPFLIALSILYGMIGSLIAFPLSNSVGLIISVWLYKKYKI